MALARNECRASLITNKFPSVIPVIGDLDSITQIASEASEADIVLNLASFNHLASASAIAQGLRESKHQRPGNLFYFLPLSKLYGALTTTSLDSNLQSKLLSGPDITKKAYGEARLQDYNDMQGIGKIRKIIASSPKRTVDNFLLNLSATQPQVQTAIIYGPLIYGLGRGLINQRSIQLPDLAESDPSARS